MTGRKSLAAVVAAMFVASIPMLGSAAGILGTPHDFSQQSWNTGTTYNQEICVVCHVPHNGVGAGQSPVGLLWNRAVTGTTFSPYTSPSIKYTPGQPNGASKLCLSCHDGTIAVDNFGGKTGGTFFVGGSRMLGSDLTNDHPVSFTYDAALAASVKTLRDPSSATSGLGGTIAQDMLRDGKVQCVSCHNPHNPGGNARFLVKSNNGSALCLTCHAFN